MVAKLTQLPDLTDPHGRRYTDEDKELAYETWKTVGGRSLRRTADLLEISPSTLGTWQQRGDWIERAKADDVANVESVKLSIRALAIPRANKAMMVIESIMDNEAASTRDRLEAAKWMAGIAGYAPVTKAETSIVTITPEEAPPDDGAPPVADIRSLTREELMERERLRRASRSRAEA